MGSSAAVARRPGVRRKTPRGPAPWWGEGKAPHLRWPGVTIQIPAVWSKANARWESPDGRYYFDAEKASKARDFFPTFLTHHIGEFASEPFELLEYQLLLIILPVFGWVSADDGLRRFRFVFVFLPKGNGKSPLGSGIGLFLTLCDEEAAAEVYAVAGDKDQGKVVHESSKIMVEQSADLQELCEVLRDSIYSARSRSSYKVISAEAAGKHGFRPHGVLFDELHNQPNRDLFEALRKSMMKRRQPLFMMLSHAGDDDESICYEEYEYAKSVLNGTANDESYLPVVFETTDKDEWTDPKVWARVNPGFGVTINPKIFAGECQAAQNDPRKKNDFLRYNLNRWTNTATPWIEVGEWDACKVGPAPAKADGARLFPRAAGMDLSQKIDLTAFVVVEREPLAPSEEQPEIEIVDVDENGKVIRKRLSLNFRVRVHPFFWIPEDTMRKREREDRVPYSLWREQGILRVSPGPTVDYDQIFDDITKVIGPRFKLKDASIGYDPAFATQLAGQLQAVGYQVVEVLQNYKHMSEPSQVFESLIYARRILHDGNPILRWNVGNVAVRQDDAGRIRPVKPKGRSASGRRRIDGVVATITGLHQLVLQPEVKDDNVYNERARAGEGSLIRWL